MSYPLIFGGFQHFSLGFEIPRAFRRYVCPNDRLLREYDTTLDCFNNIHTLCEIVKTMSLIDKKPLKQLTHRDI